LPDEIAAAEANLRSPLGAYNGERPPAPAWFEAAVAVTPEASRVTVDGSALEVLTWGEVGKPGLLFLHGNGAHAGWWRFIAPFFADTYRIAAFSWSGMGRSDHRPDYSMESFIDELFGVAAAAGLGPKPIAIAHSFGGFVTMHAAHRFGDRLTAAIIIDTPFRRPGEDSFGRPPNATNRPHKVYPTLAEALARFRYAPEQPSENAYITDLIARGSLIEAEGGWTWAFDPYLFTKFDAPEDRRLLTEPHCPVAYIWGELSRLLPPERVDYIRSQLPPGSPMIGIPDAHHHVMVDQPLALVAALRALLETWPR
jgi:pimeloyl-ACP methyl ester carboxylesterase